MKYFISVAVLSMLFGAAEAASPRPAMSGQMMRSAPRHTASINQLNSNASVVSTSSTTTTTSSNVDRREAERNACVNSNIGLDNRNTFVWASRYSDISSAANMVEDTENPENNVCFVRVELKSDDPRVSVADVPAKYFMWGDTIECGSWANAGEIERRILDAKKGARIGGIVASTLGGAGLGVGVMEAFGNRLVGKIGEGKVMGQKSEKLTALELYKSQLKVLKDKNKAEYDKIISALRTLNTDGSYVNDNQLSDDLKSLISDVDSL